MKKTLLTILCTVLVCSCVMGVTLAVLMDSTDPIVNTFTVGKVDIDLTETTGTTYKMIPGDKITKDATVTVNKGSEACYLFVKIEEGDNSSGDNKYITYLTADGWALVSGENNVYYRSVEAIAEDGEAKTFKVFKDDTVNVGINVTKDTPAVTITITAYAVQQQSLEVGEAWNQAKAASGNS